MKNLFVVGAMAASLALAACTPAAQPAGGPAPQGGGDQPTLGGVLNARVFTDFFDFDPSYDGKSSPNTNAYNLVEDTLLRFKTGPGVDFGAQVATTGLAESWEVSPDAKTITLHLRKGVKFAKVAPVNGRGFTSQDVKWNLEYYARSGQFKDKKLPVNQFDWMYEGLTSVDTPDPYTAVVRFSKPFVPFVNYMATEVMTMGAREVYEEDGSLQKRMAGTGPFIHDEASTQRGSRWVFKKNPDYWEPGKPYLDEIRYLVLPDDPTTVAAFRTKQVDVLSDGQSVTARNADEVRKSMPQATVQQAINPAPLHLYLSAKHFPFNDLRLRKAVDLAIDRDEFVKVMSNGQGGWGMPGAFSDTWTQDEIKTILKYDPAQAKKLMAEAGYPNGFDTKFLIRGNDGGEQLRTQAQLLQAQLKKVGINMTLDITADKAAGAKRLYAGDFDLIALNKALYGDVDSFLYATYHSTSAANYSFVADPEVDKLIEAQRAEVNPTKRLEVVRQVSRRLAETGDAVVIYREAYYTAWQQWVKGYYPLWRGVRQPADLWIDKS